MQLYLVRHAEATPGDPDELRPLSDEGREQARELGERLRADGVAPDVVLTSPLLRARETGEALARATGARYEADARLAPGATVETVKEAVSGRGERVVVVGHQPDCGRIAATLGGGEEPRFPAAGMVVLQL
ncbi:MAG: phosphohistidine phosphatase SixA [Actinobacteria bacterium]|nr:phosphohistidine phosphatase SixA [Actinomycetota bacterium]